MPSSIHITLFFVNVLLETMHYHSSSNVINHDIDDEDDYEDEGVTSRDQYSPQILETFGNTISDVLTNY